MSGTPDNKIPAIQEETNPVTVSGNKDIYASIPQWAPYAILVLTALIYSRVIHYGFVSLDDDAFILRNPLVRDFSWHGIKAIFTNVQFGKYQPFINLSFLLEYSFFGLNPTVFHITNVLLHLASTWVVYKFTEQLSGKQVTAIVVSVLFAIHPMHVEEVAWISERKDMLYGLFFLLAMLEYLKYLDSGLQVKHLRNVFLLFLASILSKSTAMTLPLVLVAIDMYKGRKQEKRALAEKIPFIIVAVIFAVLSIYSLHAEGGADHMQESVHLINRVFLFTSVPAFYIVKLIAPFDLTVMYYYPDVTEGLLPWQYYASLPLLLLIAWLVARKSPFQKEILFGIGFFAITISVMEQIVSVGPSFTPERYSYIPYIGLFYIIGQWMANADVSKQKKVVAVFTLFLIMFCVQTWARIGVWKNSDDLFKDVIKKNVDVTENFDFYFVRGDLKAGEGKIQEAIQDYNQCISLNPDFAEAYTNRGAMYFQSGDMKSALLDFNKSIEINPKRAKAYDNRAALEATTSDFVAALRDYDWFLKLDSNDSRGYADRGMVRYSLKDSAGACKDWKKSLHLGNKGAVELLRQYCH